jgi:hypothetical protein
VSSEALFHAAQNMSFPMHFTSFCAVILQFLDFYE